MISVQIFPTHPNHLAPLPLATCLCCSPLRFPLIDSKNLARMVKGFIVEGVVALFLVLAQLLHEPSVILPFDIF